MTWSDSINCLTCEYITNLIDTKYPTLVPDACGCSVHKIILPLFNKKGILLCREGKHWHSGKTLSEQWSPTAYAKMKPGFLYSYPNDYDGTLTEVCSVSSLTPLENNKTQPE